MSSGELEAVKRILERERRARKEAEKLLEEKSREVYDTNEKLKRLASDLERRVDKRTSELATRNTLLTSIFESIEAGILFEDIEDDEILVNQHLCDLFSIDLKIKKANQLNSADFSMLLTEQIVDHDAYSKRTAEILAKQVPVSSEEWLLKNGRFINRLFIPLKIGSKYQGPFWMYSDITYSKELESSRAAAEAGTEAKSIFLANMSHEIRTPLNGIIGMNRLLIEDGLKSKQMQYAMSVHESAQSLLQIINDILDFSKVEAGRLEFEIITFSLTDVIDSVFELLQVKSANKNLDFNVIYDPKLPSSLKGDPSRIKQVLLNLVDNAIKFTQEGSVCLRVQARQIYDEICFVQFTVEDTGIGIGIKDLAELFSPFSQADATISRRFGGTGLGLAISRKILEMMDGDIRVNSEKGKGSVFTANARFPVAESAKSQGLFSGNTEFKIVITAANLEQRESLTSMFEIEGVTPTTTSTTKDAINFLQNTKPNERILWLISCSGMALDEQIPLPNLLSHLESNCSPILLVRNEKQLAHLSLSTFETVHLPVSRKNLLHRIGNSLGIDIASQLEYDSDDESAKSLNLPPIRVLLAEDNSINQQMERITLERLGAKVDVAANGLEALQMFDQLPYDVILMDIHMPELDGVEACKRIRMTGSEIPIVALTANAMKGDKERFLAAGMNQYLSKPLIYSELVKTFRLLFAEEKALPKVDKSVSEKAKSKEIIDFEAFLSTLGGNTDMAKEILSVFCTQKEDILSILESAIKDCKWDNVRPAIHRLCGSSYSIHAHAIAKSASDLEILLVESTDSSPELEDAIDRLKVDLNQFDECIHKLN